VRVRAVHALGRMRDPRAVDPLIAMLAKQDDPVKSTVLTALGRIGDARAREPLLMLVNSEGFLRIPAARALAEMPDQRVANIFAIALRRNEAMMIAAGYRFYIRQGIEGSEPKLVNALKKLPEWRVISDYLCCGNPVLADAARSMAEARRLNIERLKELGESGPKWAAVPCRLLPRRRRRRKSSCLL